MKQLHNLLVVVDPTRLEQPAIAKAALLAKGSGARIILYGCDTAYSKEARLTSKHLTSGAAPLPLDLRTLLCTYCEPLRAEGIEVEIECDTASHLHPAVLKRVCTSGIDLVLKDTHHYSFAHRTFLTNTDWQLIRGCGAPLLFTRPTPWQPRPVVLAAVDPMHEHDKPALLDHHLLEWGATLRTILRGELHAAHAYLPLAVGSPEVHPEAASAMIASLIGKEGPARTAQVRTLVSPYDIPERNIHVDVGSPAEVIPHLARRVHADIVAMGALSRSHAELFLIGHTAERVIERVQADLLIVKPPDFSACLPM